MRKMFIWLTPVVALGAIVGWVFMATAAQAGPGIQAVAPGASPVKPQNTLAKHAVLVDSVLTQTANFTNTTGGQFNPVDSPTTVTCPAKAASCNIDATMSVELLDQSGQNGNQFAI